MRDPRPARTVTTLIAVLVTALAMVTACVGDRDGGSPDRRSGGDNPYRGGLGRPGQTPSARQVDNAVRSSLDDVERYWRREFPKLADGEKFVPVQGGRFPYSRKKLPPACGGSRPKYEPNAFYCPPGDFIAWDEETLVPQLLADFGPFLVAVVMAHEYGHAVQSRLGQQDQPTIVKEQQADCFAGSWARDVADGKSKTFDGLRPDQLDSTIGGLLFVRDQPGTSALSQQAHGNAFDRVRAFQEGFEQGPSRCAAYRADNLPVTEVPFTREDDASTGGNLPYDDAIRLLSTDLQDFWTRTFPQLGGRPWEPLKVVPYDPADPPACDGDTRSPDGAAGTAFYCAAGDFVAFDATGLGQSLYDRVGDNAIGTLLANLFARAAQDRLGQPTQGRDAQLQRDCFSGAWTSSLFRRDRAGADLTLSPGDLDEAVAAMLVFGRARDGSEDGGGASAFDRIGAYRDGVLSGLSACKT